eukprot:TRINITY_DN2196_c0_g1_i1.p1 TRINITY_DN2196_c0_g1~~TRINITY_DN2196_c0_g1_i1.p1  ORF type:complete len:435 (-),score=51.40 TRINITY_DN2196_c0_g1_i1:1332-2636(-)
MVEPSEETFLSPQEDLLMEKNSNEDETASEEKDLDSKERLIPNGSNDLENGKKQTHVDSESAKKTSELRNLLLTGTCFFLIVTAFIATQNLQSLVRGGSGLMVLGLLYGAMAFFSVIAVVIVGEIGEKNIFIVGAMGFVFFVAANIHFLPALFYFASIVNGALAGLFWVAQGAYIMTMVSEKNRGRYTGYFVMFLAMGHLVGNGLTGVLQLFPGFEFNNVFVVMTVIAGCGMVLFWMIEATPVESRKKVTFREVVRSVLQVLTDTRMLLLWPIIVAYGVNLCFIFGVYPAMVGDTLISSFGLTLFGVVHGMTCLFGPYLSWMWKGNFLVVVSASGQCIGILLSQWKVKWVQLIAGACLGVMEAGFLVQLFPLFGREFGDRLVATNSAFRLVSSIALALSFFLSAAIPSWAMSIFTLVVQLFGLVAILYRSFRKS